MSVVIFEVFLIFNFDVVWEVFGRPLGPSWRSPGTLFGGLLGPLGVSWAVLESSWELFGRFWGHHGR